jgi:hypothetical protein
MAANNPSYQHGRPYEIDDVSVPHGIIIYSRQPFRIIRDERILEPRPVANPKKTEDFLKNVRVSLR